MLKSFVGSTERFDGSGDFDGGGDENFDEVDGALADRVDAVEDETAGGGIFTFPPPLGAGTGQLHIFTYDTAAKTYADRGTFTFPGGDGQLFTGDADGDGRDEIVLLPFSGTTPAPRPANGGLTTIRSSTSGA